MSSRLFQAIQKTKVHYKGGGQYELAGPITGSGALTDLRISINRCFVGYRGIASMVANFRKWFGLARHEAEQHFEIVEYELVEVRRYTVAEARKLRKDA